MKFLVLVIAGLAAFASASVVGPIAGAALVGGPTGVVTNHGAIGPNGLPNGAATGGYGYDRGYGAVGDLGGIAIGVGYGREALLAAPGATSGTSVVGPIAGAAVVRGPSGVVTNHGAIGPDGLSNGAAVVVRGPSGVVTNHGAIGPDGLSNGAAAVVRGPSGIVTNHGAIGPDGLPNGAVTGGYGYDRGYGAVGGLGGTGVGAGYRNGAVLAAPAARAIISGPASISAGGFGLGYGSGLGIGRGIGAVGLSAGYGAGLVTGYGAGLGAGYGTGLGAGYGAVPRTGYGAVPGAGYGAAIGGVGSYGGAGLANNGGSAIALSDHGVTVRGPLTAPAVIAGPAGKVAADGLWGSTATWATGGGYGHGANY